MEIMLNITSRCNMRCKNCALETMSTKEKRCLPQDMDLSTFVKIVDKLIDYGFDEFQLTPTVGEPFLHPEFMEMLTYLESNEKVKRITFFTNLAVKNIGGKITWLMKNTTKTVMFVSVYGTNRSDFDTFTNTSKCYKNFSDNLLLLRGNYKSTFRSLNFFIRNPSYETSKQSKIYITINTLGKIKKRNKFFDGNNIQKHYWNGNWCGAREDVENKREDVKKGLCWFALIDNIVDNNGNISLCGACDVKRTTVIGNIFVDSLEKIYDDNSLMRDIVNGQGNNIYFTDCCKLCSEFHACGEEVLKEYVGLHKWTF